MSTPSSLQRQVSQLIIPPFDDVFRRFPVPSMMIAATMLVLIINHAEVPFLDFSHFEPPLSVGLNEFIVTLVTAMVWTVAVALYAASAAWSRGRQISVSLVGTAVALGLAVATNSGLPQLASSIALAPYLLLWGAITLAISAAATGHTGRVANRQILLAALALPLAIFWALLLVGTIETVLTHRTFAVTLVSKASARPVQAMALGAALFYWLAWIPTGSTAPTDDQPTTASEFMRHMGLPLLMVFYAALATMTVYAVVSWTGAGLVNGRPDFPMELSLPFLGSSLAAWIVVRGERARLGSAAETFLWVMPFAMAALALFHVVSLWRLIDPTVSLEVRVHGAGVSFWFYVIAGFCLLGSAIAIWRRSTSDVRTITVPAAVTLALLSFGPWGVHGFDMVYQRNGLARQLAKIDLFADGRVTPKSEIFWGTNISQPDAIRNQLLGLARSHGLGTLRPWFAHLPDSPFVTAANNEQLQGAILERLGVTAELARRRRAEAERVRARQVPPASQPPRPPPRPDQALTYQLGPTSGVVVPLNAATHMVGPLEFGPWLSHDGRTPGGDDTTHTTVGSLRYVVRVFADGIVEVRNDDTQQQARYDLGAVARRLLAERQHSSRSDAPRPTTAPWNGEAVILERLTGTLDARLALTAVNARMLGDSWLQLGGGGWLLFPAGSDPRLITPGSGTASPLFQR
jgi:hypothetical protein